MTKYLLFAYRDYEAGGGLNDLQVECSTYRAAKIGILEHHDFDRADIVKLENEELDIVATFIQSPYILLPGGELDRRSNNRVPYRWLQLTGYDEYKNVDFESEDV